MLPTLATRASARFAAAAAVSTPAARTLLRTAPLRHPLSRAAALGAPRPATLHKRFYATPVPESPKDDAAAKKADAEKTDAEKAGAEGEKAADATSEAEGKKADAAPDAAGRKAEPADATEEAKRKQLEGDIEKGLKDAKQNKPAADEDPVVAAMKGLWSALDGASKKGKESKDGKDSKDGKEGDKKDGDKKKAGGPNGPVELRINGQGLLLSLLTTYLVYQYTSPSASSREITWQEFRTAFLDKGQVDRLVVVNRSRVKVYLHSNATGSLPSEQSSGSGAGGRSSYWFTVGSVEAFERRLDEAQRELEIPAGQRIPVAYKDEMSTSNILLQFAPTLLIVGGLIWMTRRAASGMGGAGGAGGSGGVFGIGKSRAKMFNQETDIKTKFENVAGMDEAKEEIMEFVSFLKKPEKYEKLGAKIPRGAILSGPPGTGKTLLAKATAGEAGVPFLSVSGSEFVEMFVGVGPSRVRDMFANAKKHAPCIIFVDEIDAIGKARGKGGAMGGNDERESTLNELLVQMDGFSTTEHVVVLAGTNRPDVLDPALMRPGRFDRHIAIDRPDISGRTEIFKVHLKPLKLAEAGAQEVELLAEKLSTLTPGFSGADVANVTNEAALIAARKGAAAIGEEHFDMAIERVIAGLERKTRVLNKEEKNIVAHHEAGHAICGWFLEHADPLLKVSIIPRGVGALGYAQYLPTETYLSSTEALLDRLSMILGGRASEQVMFNSVTTGGSDDFSRASRIAYEMVTRYGMGRMGLVSYSSDQETFQKPYSEATGQQIDDEVRHIIKTAYQRTVDLLTERKDELQKVANLLLEKEVITRSDMVDLLGRRPFERADAADKNIEKRGMLRRAQQGSQTSSAPPPPPQELGGAVASRSEQPKL